MSKIKADQSVPSSVAAVFESLGTRKNPAEYMPSTFRPSEQGNGIVAYKHTPDLSQPLDSKSRGDSEATILSDLIVSCVATYQTIQVSNIVINYNILGKKRAQTIKIELFWFGFLCRRVVKGSTRQVMWFK